MPLIPCRFNTVLVWILVRPSPACGSGQKYSTHQKKHIPDLYKVICKPGLPTAKQGAPIFSAPCYPAV